MKNILILGSSGQIGSHLVKFFKIPITQKAEKLRLVIKSNKKLPKGHPAQGEYAWLFVDEILFL